MLRSLTRANIGSNVSKILMLSSSEYSSAAWPAEVPAPAGVKPFDPKGSLAQVDQYLDGLPVDDPWVETARKYKNLRVAVSKIQAERRAAGPSRPIGLATTADGAVDGDYYTQNLGIHPDFVTKLTALMKEEQEKQPMPKPSTAWEEAWTALKPFVLQEQQNVLKELEAIQAKEKELAEIEERLEEITVDEMLEKYPELAQEIKEEIEAGNWEKTDAGHKEVTAA